MGGYLGIGINLLGIPAENGKDHIL